MGWSASDGGSTLTFPYLPSTASAIRLYAQWIVATPTRTATADTAKVLADTAVLAAELAADNAKAAAFPSAKAFPAVVPAADAVSVDPASGAMVTTQHQPKNNIICNPDIWPYPAC